MKSLRPCALVLALLASARVEATPGPDSPGPASVADAGVAGSAAELEGDREAAPRWICKRGDSVCGLDDPRTLSDPARIEYVRALDATPAMKELRRKGIDPDSPAGKLLVNRAQDELRKAAEDLRQQKGHCSIWKKIRNTDGRKVPDVTDDLIASL